MILQIPDGEFDGYVFDCDGTLADTMPLHYEAWRKTLGKFAGNFPEALFYELGGVPAEQIIEMLNTRHGHNMPVVETAHHKYEIFLELIPRILPIKPVVAFVHQVYGRKPLAVASGGAGFVVRKTLQALGIIEKFDAIVCAEDYPQPKPAPDPFLEAARRIGVNPERCLAFEDTLLGVQSAASAGMKTVLVPGPDSYSQRVGAPAKKK